MQQLQISLPLQVVKHVTALRLFPYFRFILILLVGFSVTSLGVMSVAQSIQPEVIPTNLFAEYTDIFPGHSLDTLTTRKFSCADFYHYQNQSEKTCAIALSSNIFSSVNVTVENNIIHTTTFIMREDTLKVGNLILLFGKPYFRRYADDVFLFWNNLFVIILASTTGKPVAIRPVWSVTFTDIK